MMILSIEFPNFSPPPTTIKEDFIFIVSFVSPSFAKSMGLKARNENGKGGLLC